MEKYKKIRDECPLKTVKYCTYWDNPTQCHFLTCPHFYYKLSAKQRLGVKKRLQDQVMLTHDDFENKTTVQDLISQVKSSETSFGIEKPGSRMICIACGEKIVDDSYFFIEDKVTGLRHYYHSKGKCQLRKEWIPILRTIWHNKRAKEK
ncbi:MAG: hypothetical protein ACXAC8_02220 [Candidatus Hodarchaeales archaeon]|jgi:hypothetical protein